MQKVVDLDLIGDSFYHMLRSSAFFLLDATGRKREIGPGGDSKRIELPTKGKTNSKNFSIDFQTHTSFLFLLYSSYKVKRKFLYYIQADGGWTMWGVVQLYDEQYESLLLNIVRIIQYLSDHANNHLG